jgi:hypothetical protein
VDSLSIQQVLALCGDGRLIDGSPCSHDLREYFQIAKSENLFKYLQACLQASFDRSGFVLQDIVNEFGRRLDYSVENGLYQGKSGAINHDGLWIDSEGSTIIVEVKTTDAYRINLETLARYGEALLAARTVSKNCAILIVVGRQDTGDLEAQVRGSRHAWTIRLISADALVKLVTLKENTDPGLVSKIHEVLTPFEYTRLDKIIEIAFTVAEDASNALGEGEVEEEAAARQQHTSLDVLAELRAEMITAISSKYVPLIKKSRALYWSADKTVRVAVSVSKQYEGGNYWYAYRPDWDRFLSEAAQGFYVLGCVGMHYAFAIPSDWIHSRLKYLHMTERDGGGHWHIYVVPENETLMLRLKTGQNESLEPFRIPLETERAVSSASRFRR